uniref:Uncharacterized protein n=1 Tax=Anopheles maculatus TaxID=74869 RepID=A0A182TAJ7_9DIPT
MFDAPPPTGAAVTVTTVVVGVDIGFTLASVAPPAVDTEIPPEPAAEAATTVLPAVVTVPAVVAFRITSIDCDLSSRLSVRNSIGPSVPFLLNRCCRKIGPPVLPVADDEPTSSVVPFLSASDCSRIVLPPPPTPLRPSSVPLLMAG